MEMLPFTSVVNSRGSGARGLPQSQWTPEGRFPVIGQGSQYIEGRTDREDLVIRPNPALVLYGGHTRRAKLVTEPFVPGPNVKILTPDAVLDAAYLYRFLEQLVVESRGYADHFREVKRTSIPVLHLAEQKRIAAILDAVDVMRAKRRQSLAELTALTQSAFLSMFGDPVTNPMEWGQTELVDLVALGDKINYGVVQPGEDVPGGVPLVRVGDFASGTLSTRDLKAIDPRIESKYARSRLNGTELLVSCVGSVGLVSKASAEVAGYNIARAVARVPLADGVVKNFVLFCLRSAAVQRYFRKETRTVSQPTLNISLIKSTPIIQPPLDMQRRFAQMVRAVEQQTVTVKAHLNELDALFASLQYRAFNGEL